MKLLKPRRKGNRIHCEGCRSSVRRFDLDIGVYGFRFGACLAILNRTPVESAAIQVHCGLFRTALRLMI